MLPSIFVVGPERAGREADRVPRVREHHLPHRLGGCGRAGCCRCVHEIAAALTPHCLSPAVRAADNDNMRALRTPLLCELHAHTTWSDGELPIRDLVDLYATAGFDVLCITDHVVRSDDPYAEDPSNAHVERRSYGDYLGEIEAESQRARQRYDILVIPGLELTYNDPDPRQAAHALALGLRSHVSVDAGMEPAMCRAREAGAVVAAAHPFSLHDAVKNERGTARFSLELSWAATLADRFELFNRHDFFPCVAQSRLPAIATGDFHRREHLASWKTLLPCQKEEQAVLDYLRSSRPAYIALLGEREHRSAA
jgi:3',5'-nucleoside bisphosphate phosphatase